MSKPFTLFLERVHCEDSQSGEPGSDEMYLVGFGISKSGHRFTIRPRSLGSFDKGDTSSSGYPKTLVDTQVPDNESLVSTCIFLFERDSGGLAGAGDQLEALFNSTMNVYLASNANLGLSSDARQYYAFAQTMGWMEYGLEVEASDFWNGDELMQRVYHDHLPVEPPPLGISSYQIGFAQAPGHSDAGWYVLSFRYRLAPPEPVVHD